METAMSDKKLRMKLSPELADGDHWTIADTPAELLNAVTVWWEEMGMSVGPHSNLVGESFTVEVLSMTDAEVEALPDV